MKECFFDIHTTFENNTYYRLSSPACEVTPADTTPCRALKYLANLGHPAHRAQLDTAFYLHDLHHVTLDFGGTVLTLHGEIQPFIIDRCRDITIKNVTVAYARSPFSEFDILEHRDGMLRTRPGRRFPCRVENGFLIPYFENWENRNIHQNGCLWMQVYDKQSGDGAGLKVVYLGETVVPEETPPAENISQIRVRADGGDILFFGDFPADWDAGKRLVVAHERRDISNAACYHSKHVTFERYRILNGAGMGLYAVYTENLTLHEFCLFRDELSHGTVTNAADGAHLVACKGTIEITDSILEGTVDDALNVHANFYQVADSKNGVISAYRSLASHMLNAHSEVFGVGDEIAVYRAGTLEEKARYTVRQSRIFDSQTVMLTVDGSTESLCENDIIENLSTQPQLTIRRTRFAKSNAHLRLQTRRKVLLENCFFSLPILLTGDMNYWFECSPIRDLTVRHCRFSGERATVRAIPEFTATNKAPYYHRGLTLEDNVFDHHVPLEATACADICFQRNRAADGSPLRLTLSGCSAIQAP